ncbi:hypothetical protein C8R46DRAFT_1239348 [Mycena filopes]|nr:hypothetical protein C8R46DRAFT_1239348 [Mycena filopes]
MPRPTDTWEPDILPVLHIPATGRTGHHTGPINIIGSPGSADNPLMVHPSEKNLCAVFIAYAEAKMQPPPPPILVYVQFGGQQQTGQSSVSASSSSIRSPHLPVASSASTRMTARIPARRLASGQPYPPGLLGDSSVQGTSQSTTRRERLTAQDAVNVARARLQAPLLHFPFDRRRSGMRDKRAVPLTVNNVLLTNATPPAVTTDCNHQVCGICLHLKSHQSLICAGIAIVTAAFVSGWRSASPARRAGRSCTARLTAIMLRRKASRWITQMSWT